MLRRALFQRPGGSTFDGSAIDGFSRIQEHDADVYGLEVIHGLMPDSADVAAHAFQVLGEVDLADPNPHPLVEWFFYDHPAIAKRIAMARDWRQS